MERTESLMKNCLQRLAELVEVKVNSMIADFAGNLIFRKKFWSLALKRQKRKRLIEAVGKFEAIRKRSYKTRSKKGPR